MRTKPLPPWAKDARPQHNEFFVDYGFDKKRGWQQSKGLRQLGFYHILMLPEGDSPYKYRWPVAGYGVVTINGGLCGEHESNQLTQALLDAGALYVVDCCPHIEPQPRFYHSTEQRSYG